MRPTFFILSLIPPADERDPIGCCVQRWHCHRLVLSERGNPFSNKKARDFGEWNQMEPIHTRRFCCFSSDKKRREFFDLFICSYFFIWRRKEGRIHLKIQSMYYFSSFWLILVFPFLGRKQCVVVQHASAQRRYKSKSFLHIATAYVHLQSRVDFC